LVTGKHTEATLTCWSKTIRGELSGPVTGKVKARAGDEKERIEHPTATTAATAAQPRRRAVRFSPPTDDHADGSEFDDEVNAIPLPDRPADRVRFGQFYPAAPRP
jgi:hypothetical protein